ncbi:MAG: sigma-54-dependent Fis family transcriptional regulator [Desulfamplus sp.]|nr:sigma-54-dependent Fis family transcriptional regulator [Desulfamplus sp.]
MEQPLILIIEDEQIARDNLAHILVREGYRTVCAENGAVAINELKKQQFDLILTDLRMQPIDGIEVLEYAKRENPKTEVIVITGFASISSAVHAMQKGAFHYLPKPYNIEEVRIVVRRALEKLSLTKEVAKLKQQVKQHQATPLIIGKSPKIDGLKKLISQIASTDCNVLILGETGTGKELVAREIHRLSSRAEKRFLAVNCAAFNEELLANELFGHEKEAFTGAKGIKKGLFETASYGTVFLDEVGDMPLSMQVKLLRVIQERRLIRVGGTDEILVDIRVIAATNKDLKVEVEKGNFRQDLYYRLNVISLNVPSLSERRDDIPLLCGHFLQKFSLSQRKEVKRISDNVISILMKYQFPGNIRELENIMERAVALTEVSEIEPRHLPEDIQQMTFQIQGQREGRFMTLEENEKDYIVWILEQTGNNKTKAAEILGIDRVSLWRKLRRFNLEL